MDIDQLRAVRAILRWDDTSTAAELVYYFVHELNVMPTEAWKAVYDRPPFTGYEQRGVSEIREAGFGNMEPNNSNHYSRFNAQAEGEIR